MSLGISKRLYVDCFHMVNSETERSLCMVAHCRKARFVSMAPVLR